MRREVAEAKLAALGKGAALARQRHGSMSAAAPSAPTTPLDGARRGARRARPRGPRAGRFRALRRRPRRPSSTRCEPSWDALPPDAHLRDGGRYRRRRHCELRRRRRGTSALVAAARALAADRIQRPAWRHRALVRADRGRRASPRRRGAASCCAFGRSLASRLKGAQPWYVEAHQFRIDTTDGIGRPTPEGAHRDGVDFVAVVLVDRAGHQGRRDARLRRRRSGRAALHDARAVDDARSSTTRASSTRARRSSRSRRYGHRDTLVLTFRAGGFQGASR